MNVLRGLVMAFPLFISGTLIGHAEQTSCEIKEDQNMSMNENLMNAAWEHFNKSEYDHAISCALTLIDEFQPAALRKERELATSNHSAYPEGEVTDSALKKEIFSTGPLNDVATANFVAGRSSERLRSYSRARQFFESCQKLTYARTFDPRGWFWSTSQACSDRLSALP